MPVTWQVAQALSTDNHIVGGTDDDNKDVRQPDCVKHQTHRWPLRQCGGSEWGHQAERVSDIARKLLVVIWNVLTTQAPDRRAEPELVAKYLMNWASQHGLSNQHLGIRRPVFVRQQLDRLGIGQDLQGFKWGSTYFKLPPSSLLEQSPQPMVA